MVSINSGNSTNDMLLKVGIVIGAYFLVVKPITDKLGLTKDKDDKKRDDANEAASNVNGWNPNFWRDYIATHKGEKVCIKTDTSVAALAKRIYNAWGVFNDDENAIYSALRELRSQVQLSQLCEKYAAAYQTDLLTRLKNPWFYKRDGLEPDEFNEVAKIVNKLPVNTSTSC